MDRCLIRLINHLSWGLGIGSPGVGVGTCLNRLVHHLPERVGGGQVSPKVCQHLPGDVGRIPRGWVDRFLKVDQAPLLGKGHGFSQGWEWVGVSLNWSITSPGGMEVGRCLLRFNNIPCGIEEGSPGDGLGKCLTKLINYPEGVGEGCPGGLEG